MGTRADFYIGRGLKAEWLGSIAWDGYPPGIPKGILKTRLKEVYRKAVNQFISGREDGTLPEQGWPWPWEDSQTTDYAYAFDKGQVMASCFGYDWFDPTEPEPEDSCDDEKDKATIFPNMKDVQNVSFGDRSGVIILSVAK
ncbi:hypothetical protein LCGC14_0812850 [marine sediment metagenome]|uniref:Uncharacterized protein n=1 Tax=marine sediment metagenome TaxID=412755 RepID=A0A0F9PL45_9ZZZZ